MWPSIRHMFLWKNISSSADSKRAYCQLLAKELTLYTGKLPLGGLPRKNVVLKDYPVMTSAVYFGHKASNQTKPCNKKLLILGIVRMRINNNRSTSLERSVINGMGAGGLHLYNQHDHQFLQWFKTFTLFTTSFGNCRFAYHLVLKHCSKMCCYHPFAFQKSFIVP